MLSEMHMPHDYDVMLAEVMGSTAYAMRAMAFFDVWDVDLVADDWLAMLRMRFAVSSWDKCWPPETKRVALRKAIDAHPSSSQGTLVSRIASLGLDTSDTHWNVFRAFLLDEGADFDGAAEVFVSMGEAPPEAVTLMDNLIKALLVSSLSSPRGYTCPVVSSVLYDNTHTYSGMCLHKGAAQ